MDFESPAPSAPTKVRKPRSDGQRNRDVIIQVAKAAFTEFGGNASLDEIAKRAGVGPGTLYRHFPTREHLLEAVYEAEVDNLAQAADRFRAELPPIEALRTWLNLFIDYLATKKIIAAALSGFMGQNGTYEQSMPKMHAAVTSIYEHAMAAGEIRADIDPSDHLRAIVGVAFFSPAETARDSALRLVEILIAGSRPLG